MIDYDSDLPDGNAIVKQNLYFTTALATFAFTVRVGDLVSKNDPTRAYNFEDQNLEISLGEFFEDLAKKMYTGGTEAIKPVSFEEIADDGTNFANYGQKARATYIDSTNPFRIGSGSLIGGNYLDVAGPITKGIMRDFTLMAQQNVGEYAFYTGPTVYKQLEDLYGTTNNFVNAERRADGTLTAGFSAIIIDGITVALDRGVPAGKIYVVNTTDIGLDYVDVSAGTPQDYGNGNEAFVPVLNIPSTMITAQKNTRFKPTGIYLTSRSRGNKLKWTYNLLMDFAVTSQFPSVQGLMDGITSV